MFDLMTKSEYEELSKTPSENAPAERHVKLAIARNHYRENKTTDVVINAEKLEEFYNEYRSVKAKLKKAEKAISEAKSALDFE